MPGTSPRDDGRDTAVLKAPQIKALAERLLEGAMLAAERAVAQLEDPSSQAFPRSARSLEAVLLKRLRARPAASQRAAKAWLATRRAGSRHPHVAAVNLSRATAVMDQLRKVAPTSAITLATLKSEGFPMPLAAPLPSAIAQQNAYSKIALRIGKLRCIEETDGPGDDEITLTGIALRPTGKSKQLTKIFNEALFNRLWPRHLRRQPGAARTLVLAAEGLRALSLRRRRFGQGGRGRAAGEVAATT